MEMNSKVDYQNGSSSNTEDGNVNNSILECLNNMSSAEGNVTGVSFTPYEQRLATYIIPFIFTLIFIIGVLGNGCLILIFFRHRAMRNVPNT